MDMAAGTDIGSVSSWVAASIAAFSAAIVLWVRWRDRRQADWIVAPFTWHHNVDAGVFEAWFDATNVGDGEAHQVRLVGHGSEAEFRKADAPLQAYTGHWVIPVVAPGESIRVYAHMPAVDMGWMGRRGATLVELQWLSTPTRHRRLKRAYVDFLTLHVQDRDRNEGAGLPVQEPWHVRWFLNEVQRARRRQALLAREGQPSRFFKGRR